MPTNPRVKLVIVLKMFTCNVINVNPFFIAGQKKINVLKAEEKTLSKLDMQNDMRLFCK